MNVNQSKLINFIISEATDFENFYHDKVVEVVAEGNKVTFRIKNNVLMTEWYNNPLFLYVNAIYNVDTNTIKMTVENSEGSKKYNSNAKHNVSSLIQSFIKTASQRLQFELKEEKQRFYDATYTDMRSLYSDNWERACHYLNLLHDALVEENTIEDIKAIWNELSKQINKDTILHPVMIAAEETTYTNEDKTYTVFNRSFSSYAEALQYCLSCDFDECMIIEEGSYIPSSIPNPEPITMELQFFAEPIQPTIEENKTLVFNNYDVLRLSHKEWEKDVSKHNTKYLQLREKEKINQSDILDLINNNYSFSMHVINAEPYFNPHCVLVDVTLRYINKGLTKYIPKDEYNYISSLYNYKS
jgi:hypothetical protein